MLWYSSCFICFFSGYFCDGSIILTETILETMSNKYEPLRAFLSALPADTWECTLNFSDIEELLGQDFPASALLHRPWWANQTSLDNRPQAKAWKSAGFAVDTIRQGEGGWVRFKRSAADSAAPAKLVKQKQAKLQTHSGRAEHLPAEQQTVAYDARSIALVSCVATKRSDKCAARDLYVSSWFKKVRQHVEAAGIEWYILSAKYGLLHPNQLIEPYELTLNNMSVRDRHNWAHRVQGQFHEQLPGRDRFVLFAGFRYREFLQPLLEAEGAEVKVPMAGLTQGWQLNWLDSHQAHAQA